MTAAKIAFGKGLPRSNGVGCDCSFGSYSAETTTPQTVAVSPIWRAASSGLRGAAMVEKVHSPKAAEVTNSPTGLILNLLQCSPGQEIIAKFATMKAEPAELLRVLEGVPYLTL